MTFDSNGNATNGNSTTSYSISEHINVLTPAKGSRTKHHCPVCNGNDLDINRTTGAYKCFNGCLNKDIRAAIDKLEGKPEWKPERDDWVKPIRPKSSQDYYYSDREGNPLVKVQRIDPGDGTIKSFPQYHWKNGDWKKGNPKEIRHLIPVYRHQEVRQAIERSELIFWVEGENIADLLWEMGIAATTTIGGSGAYSEYGNYQADLSGARLALTPDRDSNGLKYIANIERDFPAQIEGYYLAGTQGLWRNPQGGMDIGDDIRDLQLTKEQILAKVITAAEYATALKNPNVDTNVDNVDKSKSPARPSTIDDIKARLYAIHELQLSSIDLHLALVELSQKFKVSVPHLEKILAIIDKEADKHNNRPELKNEIDRLMAAQATTADINYILPPNLAKPISQLAESLGHNCEPYMLYLTTGTGGVVHSQSCIRLRKGYEQPGNLYGGVVAVSGSMKSPVQQQMLTKPLAQLQKSHNERYKDELEKYEHQMTVWDALTKEEKTTKPRPTSPHHHIVYANSITMEALESAAAKQPTQSAIYIKDELKGIFLSANQYRKGDDIQNLLSYYDGQQLNKIRAGTGFISSNHDIKFTVMGTIQPAVLLELASGSNDDDGLMSRFLFANLTCKFVPMTSEGGVDVVDLVAGIYRKVNELPATTYKLTTGAFTVFAAAFDRMRMNALDPTRKGWERNVWSKAGGQLGRLILNLHLIWNVDKLSTLGSTLSTIPENIEPETVKRAIALIKYFVDQAIGIIAEQSVELSPQLAKILSVAQQKGAVSPRLLCQSINGKHKPANTSKALELLKELEQMGYGSLSQSAKSYLFTTKNTTNSNVDNVDTNVDNLSTLLSSASNGFQTNVDNVDKNLVRSDFSLPKIQTEGSPNEPTLFDERVDRLVDTPPINTVEEDVYNVYVTHVNGVDTQENVSTFVSTLQPELSTLPPNVDNFQMEIELATLTSLASTLVMAAYQSQGEAMETIGELYSVWGSDNLHKAHEILREHNAVAFQQLTNLLRQYQQRQC
jgi:hypothetical protein